MAKTYIQEGNVVTVTAPTNGVKSGDVLVVGNLIGVCNIDAAEGAETELSLTGVWELPKASGQINAGAVVWWDTRRATSSTPRRRALAVRRRPPMTAPSGSGCPASR